MVRSGKNGAVRTFGTAGSSRNREICQRYATGLYRQAFVTLADSAQDEMMWTLRYVAEVAVAAAGAPLEVLAVRPLPDVRRYLVMRKM